MFPQEPMDNLQNIARAVLKLSDYYIQNPEGSTPWHEPYCQLAYRHYYLPLNGLRFNQLLNRGEELGFFEDLTSFIDWGCGPGTASLSLAAHSNLKKNITKQILFDQSAEVHKKFSDLKINLINPEYCTKLDLNNLPDKKKSCLILSYSFTEIQTLPLHWEQYEALVIMEPSLTKDARRLMELRNTLLKAGYVIWAPCTHELECPLLKNSKTDWCHDRKSVEAPDWFLNLQEHLPIKNNTVTFSYLLARKKPKPHFLNKKIRIVGDTLEEKGKTRQLICRNSDREFLTWMHKKISPQNLLRGDLIELPENIELKSNEVRLLEPIKVVE